MVVGEREHDTAAEEWTGNSEAEMTVLILTIQFAIGAGPIPQAFKTRIQFV